MEESSWRRTAPLVRLYVFFFITFDDQSLLNCPLLRIALSSTQKVGPPLVCPDSLQVESIVSPSGRRSSTGTNGFQPAQQESGLSLYSLLLDSIGFANQSEVVTSAALFD